MVVIEYEQCVHFEDSLRDNLRVLIAPQRERDFSTLVEKAKITEEVKCTERQNRDRERGKDKRDSEPSSFVQRPKKKARANGPVRAGPPVAVLDRSHVPVMVDTIKLRLSVESTVSKVTILSPLGQLVRVSKLYRDVPLEVQGTVVLADFMELPFREFDMILGMGWLVKHRSWLGSTSSALVAEKLVHKGCEAFLAYINISDSGDSTVKDIKMVKDFLDIFPEELLGLPPNREVELGIEILLGTAPVSIALYRMAPKELTELKA
ncbi:uncharacterized protein LOC108455086 [Gossypium arboreum]|uniref:uncharacterized protein LOC108455086 n=1 Tax=Gossypium arboreum TaxID=29729 RepID=UPI00081936AE|nr:uncharacterized protein LOC108455086 [Gossypium arboreum]